MYLSRPGRSLAITSITVLWTRSALTMLSSSRSDAVMQLLRGPNRSSDQLHRCPRPARAETNSHGRYAGCFPRAQVSLQNAVTLVRAAIWQLFEDGLIDADSATLALLALDVGVRRVDAIKSWPASMREYLSDRVRAT